MKWRPLGDSNPCYRRERAVYTTFMAKPYPGQAGNGLHVHISLLDKHGNNIFTSENPEQNAALRHAIGGVLETLPASMAFLCPNVNARPCQGRGREFESRFPLQILQPGFGGVGES